MVTISPSLRVLFVTNTWPAPDAPWRGSFTKSQADSLCRLGVELDVLDIPGYRSRAEYLRAITRIARRRRFPYDVVHAHYGHSGVVARCQLRAPLVVSYCGSDLLAPGARREKLEAAVFRQLARVTAATITKSHEMALRLPPRARLRNTVIPNGVDLARFRPLPRAEARRRLGWEAEAPVLLFVSNPAIETKNFPVARTVYELVRRRLPDAVLRIADEVPHELMPLWMSAADVLLFPSRSEGSPNAVKEAMAMELPIVSSCVGDVPELLGGVPGCFVLAPDPAPMAEATLEALRRGRVPAAREAILPLALETVARRVLDVYERVLSRRGPASRQ